MVDEKDWTVMIYMAGDNNLSAEMAYALSDIRDIIDDGNDSLNLLVYYDSAVKKVPTVYCDFTDFGKPVYHSSKIFKKRFVRKNQDESEEDDLQNSSNNQSSNENSASIFSVLNFIDWCVNDVEYEENVNFKVNGEIQKIHRGRKAKKYALIFSGHGSAFQNMSLMVDASSDYYMTIPKLRVALTQMTTSTPALRGWDKFPFLLKQKIDILGFDSCVMGMAEIGYEFRTFAKTMVASEGSIPSAGWKYGNVLRGIISKNDDSNEKAIAAGFVKDFIEKQTEFLIGGVSVDLAAWDLTRIDPVIIALNNLGKNLLERLKLNDDNSIRLKRAILMSHWECQSYMTEHNVDLKDFCQLLSDNVSAIKDEKKGKSTVSDDCRKVIQAVDDCILLCGFSGGSFQYSNGISVFFPWTEVAYNQSKGDYEKLRVLQEKNNPAMNGEIPLANWNEFLQYFICTAAIRQPRNQALSNNGIQIEGDSATKIYYPSKNSHIFNDKNNPLLGNDKNNQVLNDKNNHVLNDRNNQVLNDKGLQIFLMNQFKNVRNPWNIAGFTKDVSLKKANSK